MAAPFLYTYKEDTGEHLSKIEALLDPLETKRQGKQVYSTSVPGTTTVPPLTPSENEAAVFQNGAWELVADYRGKIAYATASGIPGKVTTLGPLPDGYTLLPPPDSTYKWEDGAWVLDVDKAKEIARNERNNLFDAVDQAVLRHAREKRMVEAGTATATTYTEDQMAELDVYAQALCDFMTDWYVGKDIPAKPEWF